MKIRFHSVPKKSWVIQKNIEFYGFKSSQVTSVMSSNDYSRLLLRYRERTRVLDSLGNKVLYEYLAIVLPFLDFDKTTGETI